MSDFVSYQDKSGEPLATAETLRGGKVTYWLYDGKRVLTSVRAEIDAPDAVIIGDAIRSHEEVPLCMPEFTPYEFTRMLKRAVVRL